MELPNLPKNMTSDEFLALINGEDLDTYREEKKERSRIQSKAEKLIGLPSSQWPEINFNWDLSQESQRFSLDGENQKSFKENHPNGFLLGMVKLEDFDNKLCHFSRRDEGELWELGFKSKLAFLIAYLSEGGNISPPFVKPLETDEVILQGGHHRYAIAKEIKVREIPIHIEPNDQSRINDIINVRWKNA